MERKSPVLRVQTLLIQVNRLLTLTGRRRRKQTSRTASEMVSRLTGMKTGRSRLKQKVRKVSLMGRRCSGTKTDRS